MTNLGTYETTGLGRLLVNCVDPFISQYVAAPLNGLAHKNADMITPSRKAMKRRQIGSHTVTVSVSSYLSVEF